MSLQEAVIQAKYVNPPKQGRTFGNVKTPNDELYWGEAPIIARIQPGSTVTVRWEPQKWGEKTAQVIKSVVDAPKPEPVAGAPAPAPASNGWHKTADEQEMIFITGVVGRAMGSGQFGAAEVKNLALAARDAYRALKGPKAPEEPPPFLG